MHFTAGRAFRPPVEPASVHCFRPPKPRRDGHAEAASGGAAGAPRAAGPDRRRWSHPVLARRYPARPSRCSMWSTAPALKAWSASRPTAVMSRVRPRLGSRRRLSRRRSSTWSASAASAASQLWPCWPAMVGPLERLHHAAGRHPRAAMGTRPAARQARAQGQSDRTGQARHCRPRALSEGRGAVALCDAARLARRRGHVGQSATRRGVPIDLTDAWLPGPPKAPRHWKSRFEIRGPQAPPPRRSWPCSPRCRSLGNIRSALETTALVGQDQRNR